ncbi:MAG: hypothetical protein AAGC60_00195 [Acidobacteriota bacterium]
MKGRRLLVLVGGAAAFSLLVVAMVLVDASLPSKPTPSSAGAGDLGPPGWTPPPPPPPPLPEATFDVEFDTCGPPIKGTVVNTGTFPVRDVSVLGFALGEDGSTLDFGMDRTAEGMVLSPGDQARFSIPISMSGASSCRIEAGDYNDA